MSGQTLTESDLLQATIREWGERITFEQEVNGAHYQLTAHYNGETVVTYFPNMTKLTFTGKSVISILWAQTAVLWTHPTAEEYCKFMHLDAQDPDDLLKFELWREIARDCIRIFGKTFGNTELLFRGIHEPT